MNHLFLRRVSGWAALLLAALLLLATRPCRAADTSLQQHVAWLSNMGMIQGVHKGGGPVHKNYSATEGDNQQGSATPLAVYTTGNDCTAAVNGQGCTSQTDCTSALCTSGGSNTGPNQCTNYSGCTSDGSCTLGTSCTNGDSCTADSVSCTLNASCTSGDACTKGSTCTDGSRTSGCTAGDNCTNGTGCTGGLACTASNSGCTNKPYCTTGFGCTTNISCTTGGSCTQGSNCTRGRACTSQENCSSRGICTQGANCTTGVPGNSKCNKPTVGSAAAPMDAIVACQIQPVQESASSGMGTSLLALTWFPGFGLVSLLGLRRRSSLRATTNPNDDIN